MRIPPTGIPLEDIERQAVTEALNMSSWTQKDAAELLAISPRVMNYKIKTLKIELPRSRRPQVAEASERHPSVLNPSPFVSLRSRVGLAVDSQQLSDADMRVALCRADPGMS